MTTTEADLRSFCGKNDPRIHYDTWRKCHMRWLAPHSRAGHTPPSTPERTV